MALTDPELDLLLEMLEDEHELDVVLQVGAELVRRGQWARASSVLQKGLVGEGDEEGLGLLARAQLELGDYGPCLATLARMSLDPTTDIEASRIEMLALERSGSTERARERALLLLEVDPHDVVVTSALERLNAPPPDDAGRATDPFVTVERAEKYVAVGRSDRAVRLYRRLVFHNPKDRSIALRLAQLSAESDITEPDDLSEELTDPGLTPPEFSMPSPGLSQGPAEKTSGGRRRRRSLIRR